jgi:hypothetical protein
MFRNQYWTLVTISLKDQCNQSQEWALVLV